MARCEVTVEGRTLVVEGKSLCHAAIAYNAAQICGQAREYPRLQMDTEITVRVDGRRGVHRIVWQDVLEWANRVAEENARRWFAERAEKERRKGAVTQKAARVTWPPALAYPFGTQTIKATVQQVCTSGN